MTTRGKWAAWRAAAPAAARRGAAATWRGAAAAAVVAASTLSAVGTMAAPLPVSAELAAARAKLVVSVLSAEGMRGRGNGAPELAKARDLVRQWMIDAGAAGVRLQSFEGPNGTTLENVVGTVAGTGEEWIVVGAHYDHLGVGVGGEHSGSVFPGADDNASGVAALLHVATRLAGEKNLQRGIVFAAFAGEEIGLLGSRAFVAAPPVPIENVAAMINFDTVGRLEANRLIVFGSGTAEEFPEILRGVNYVTRFDLALNSEGPGASDHTPFFEKGIPVLHLFSGANADYHRPTDTADKVSPEGIVRIADFAAEIVLHLAASEAPLAFVPAGAEKLASRTGAGAPRRVSPGTIPDFAREKGGVRLQGVLPKSAAEEAGREEGDILVGIDDVDIDTIDDYQAALAAHSPGDQVVVKYVRAGVTKSTKAVLRERSR